MFRILHTADWHLGKQLCGYDRSNEFEIFFKRLINCLETEKIDLLAVAGDIFDTSSPSNAVAKSYYNLICNLHFRFPDLQIVVTAGNHDSPSFLNAPASLLDMFSAKVVGSVARKEEGIDWSSMVFEIKQKSETAAIICAIPYLRRGDLSLLTNNQTIAGFFEQAYQYANNLRAGRKIPIIAMGHLTTFNASYNDTISVGGQDNVDTETLPDGFAYIALGHIHKPQHCGNRLNVRYSGSPLPFSFNEKNYNSSVCVVEFEDEKLVDVKKIPFPHVVALRVVPKEPSTMEQIKEAILQIPDNEDLFLEINIIASQRTPENRNRIVAEFLANKKARFCNWHFYKPKNELVQTNLSTMQTAQEFKQRKPIDVMQEIYQMRCKETMPESMYKMLAEIVEQSENELNI